MHWPQTIFLASSFLFFPQLEILHPGSTEIEVQEFAARVFDEGRTGERVSLPADILRKSSSSVDLDTSICTPLHRNALHVYRIP